MKKNKAFLLVFILLLFLCTFFLQGCGRENEKQSEETQEQRKLLPVSRDDGKPFQVAYIDYDQYQPSTRQLYYIIEALQKNGWISETEFSFNEKTEDAMEIIKELELSDIGPYLSFRSEDSFYIAYEDLEMVKETLIRDVKNGNIDMIISSGTNAGLFVQELDLSVPMLNVGSTDPVSSGLIESTENSGNPYIWAQVEPSVPLRQLKYYHNLIPFEKLGVVIYGDEIISAVADQERAAEEEGFQLVKYHIPEMERETAQGQEQYYKMLSEYYHKLVEEDQVDGYFLTIDVINELDKVGEYLEIFYENEIPVFLMDDENVLEKGGLMLIAAYDYENVGKFVAETMAKTFRGAEVGDLPCVYRSAPYICLNMDVARRIQYKPTFEFLLSCDRIIGETR